MMEHRRFKPEYMGDKEHEEKLAKDESTVHLLWQINQGEEGQTVTLRAVCVKPEKAEKYKEALKRRDARHKITGTTYRIDCVLIDHIYAYVDLLKSEDA